MSRRRWDSALHPRDTRGRFTDSPSSWASRISDRIRPDRPITSGQNRIDWANKLARHAQETEDEDAAIFNFGPLGDPRDGVLAMVGREQGFDGLPISASADQLDAEIDRGGVEIWRGVKDFAGATTYDSLNRPGSLPPKKATEIDRMFRGGDYQPGTGIYGNGFYFSASERVGKHYAGKKGVTTRAVLRSDARVIDLEEAQRKVQELYNDESLDFGLRMSVLGDPGRVAALLGYDAIRVPEGKQDGAPYKKGEPAGKNGVGKRFSAAAQYVILNRTALLVEAG